MSFAKKWSETKDDELNAELIAELLEDVSDDIWVTAACAERVVSNPEVAQVLVKTGLRRSTRVIESIKGSLASYEHIGETEDSAAGPEQSLQSYFRIHERERRLCILRQLLFDRLDRIQTFLIMENAIQAATAEDERELEEDDPWADPEEEEEKEDSSPGPKASFTLFEFLSQPLVDSAIILASEQRFRALDLLQSYHDAALFPYRFSILDAIPLSAHPSEYHHLLPAADYETNMEIKPQRSSWREKPDWVEETSVVDALRATSTPEELAWLDDMEVSDDEFPRVRKDSLLKSEELTDWYTRRVESTDSQSGLLDTALALLQHGASQGVPRLDELGEDLILLDRLVYEAPQPSDPSLLTDWSLARWRTMSPPEVIKAYLAFSDFESVAEDIRRLVLPYLSVLEAQAERAKRPDLELVNRLLYDYILHAPLELVVAIFESSKADMQRSYRIVRNDEDVARLALAYVYGLPRITDWPMMSRIFECQPDWGDDRDEDDEAYATLTSLAEFVAPSASRDAPSAEELFIFFKPLPASALSRLLDILDSHLEGAEILDKWGVATNLQWFILSRKDEGQQRARAVRMSRRSGDSGEALEDEQEWRDLLEDMLKLTAKREGNKSAFCMLSREEITRIFFTGLLSSGNFAVAKRIKGRGSAAKYLTGPVVEELCLNVSRELYDNASSGNMHRGDMKTAYECLTVATPSPKVQAEREFIEATSKICSFNVMTRPGISITPLEIRLTKDRLELIARVLSSSEDAYKHQEVILDLAHKLGFKNDVAAEVKILAMLVEVALQHEDFMRAQATCERMMVDARRLRSDMSISQSTHHDEALEVAWRCCYQLGRQSEFHDTPAKMRLLGFAIELCPTDNTLDILAAWRKIEAEDIDERKKRSAARAAARPTGKRRETGPSLLQVHAGAAAGSLLKGLREFSQGQEAATHMLSRVTANLPFSLGGGNTASGGGRRSDEMERSGSSPRDFGQLFSRNLAGTPSPRHHVTDEVAATARHALARGMGWLIGGDDDDR
ncbi:hypothetical protein PIIN_07483 [Serendipita indica DSM 11827]|uniref:Sec39 domain-containing protein n=1 Tax=Serendipita indica (strain DSM 11827) TaxID=1109443 RepID=G4TQE3_SERID|nr:hypothetical protein PIIN_07483 [Serendipita indica DSM 11827]